MMARCLCNWLVDLPFTEMPEDIRTHSPPVSARIDPYVRGPARKSVTPMKKFDVTFRTFHFGVVNTTKNQLSISNALRSKEQAKEGGETLLYKPSKEAFCI